MLDKFEGGKLEKERRGRFAKRCWGKITKGTVSKTVKVPHSLPHSSYMYISILKRTNLNFLFLLFSFQVVAFLSSTVWASETEGESPSDGIIGSRTSSLSSLSPVSEAAVSRFLGRSDELVDQARLIFDLGDITINFIPLIVFAKLILLARESLSSGYSHTWASNGHFRTLMVGGKAKKIRTLLHRV